MKKPHKLLVSSILAFSLLSTTNLLAISNKDYEAAISNCVEYFKKAEVDVASSSLTPLFIIVCGPMGSGKTNLVELAKRNYPKEKFAVINQDFYRPFHPDVENIRKYSLHPTLDTKDFIRTVRAQLIDYATENRKNIIFENPMASEEIVEEFLHVMYKSLLPNGYKIIVYAMNTSPEICLFSGQKRYSEQLSSKYPFPMPPASRELLGKYIEGFHRTIKLFSEDLDMNVQVYERGKTPQSLPIKTSVSVTPLIRKLKEEFSLIAHIPPESKKSSNPTKNNV